jgi:hypothetical protein
MLRFRVFRQIRRNDPIESRPVTMTRAELEAVWNRKLIFIAKRASLARLVARAAPSSSRASHGLRLWGIDGASRARQGGTGTVHSTLKPNAGRSSSLAANAAVQSASYGRLIPRVRRLLRCRSACGLLEHRSSICITKRCSCMSARFKTYLLRSLFQIKMSKLKRWTDEADEFFLCP